MSILKRYVAVIVLLAAAVYLGAAGYLVVNQRSYVFKPSGQLGSPADAGLAGVTVEQVAMADGTMVTVWTAPAAGGNPTVLYFHGNAGNISTRADRFAQILASGFGLYAPSHRGYAGSGGSPGEAALVADGLAHFDRLARTSDRIIVYGESLGAGIATAVAADRDALALALEAPFTSAVDIAAATYPWLPVSILMRDPFLSNERIARVAEPVLIVHGTADVVIPVAHGEALFGLANEPKAMARIDGVGHAGLWDAGLWPRVTEFLAGKVPPASD